MQRSCLAMDYIPTDFGVNSSSRIPLRVLNTQSWRHNWTACPCVGYDHHG